MRYGADGHSADYVQRLFSGGDGATMVCDSTPDGLHLEADPNGEGMQGTVVTLPPVPDYPPPELQPPLSLEEHYESLGRYGVGESPTTNFAWVQCLRAISVAWDLTTGISQHFTPNVNEIFFVPLVIAQWLLTNRPTDWQQYTVIPGTLHPGSSGSLDILSGISTQVWGINSQGQAVFTTDGDLGTNDTAQMYVFAGQPYLLKGQTSIAGVSPDLQLFAFDQAFAQDAVIAFSKNLYGQTSESIVTADVAITQSVNIAFQTSDSSATSETLTGFIAATLSFQAFDSVVTSEATFAFNANLYTRTADVVVVSEFLHGQSGVDIGLQSFDSVATSDVTSAFSVNLYVSIADIIASSDKASWTLTGTTPTAQASDSSATSDVSNAQITLPAQASDSSITSDIASGQAGSTLGAYTSDSSVTSDVSSMQIPTLLFQTFDSSAASDVSLGQVPAIPANTMDTSATSDLSTWQVVGAGIVQFQASDSSVTSDVSSAQISTLNAQTSDSIATSETLTGNLSGTVFFQTSDSLVATEVIRRQMSSFNASATPDNSVTADQVTASIAVPADVFTGMLGTQLTVGGNIMGGVIPAVGTPPILFSFSAPYSMVAGSLAFQASDSVATSDKASWQVSGTLAAHAFDTVATSDTASWQVTGPLSAYAFDSLVATELIRRQLSSLGASVADSTVVSEFIHVGTPVTTIQLGFIALYSLTPSGAILTAHAFDTVTVSEDLLVGFPPVIT